MVVALPFALQAARIWRDVLTGDLADARLPRGVVDDALLVASELAGNAVLHARALPDGGLLGGWELRSDSLVLELVDGGSPEGETPAAKPPSTERPSGRGLALVDALSAAWGVEERVADGRPRTRVWVVLPLGGAGSPGEPGRDVLAV